MARYHCARHHGYNMLPDHWSHKLIQKEENNSLKLSIPQKYLNLFIYLHARDWATTPILFRNLEIHF